MKLRKNQEDFVNKILGKIGAGCRRICGVAPCGFGKTVVAGYMAQKYTQYDKNVLFMVHRKELIEQTSKTFCKLGIAHGIISSGVKPNYNLPVQIAGVQTLVKRIDKIPKPDLLICDECHHIIADTYKTIVNSFESAVLLGITATPLRRDGDRLADAFDDIVVGPSVSDLIESGDLAHYEYYEPTSSFSEENVEIRAGDYDNNAIFSQMNRAKVIGDIVSYYKRIANHEQAIYYCVNIEHSINVARRFNKAGIVAEHVDGETPKQIRADAIDKFRHGKIQVLCNVDLFGEGFDVPNVDCVGLARPTKSLTLYIQQAMRAMRPDPKNPRKIAKIIDHVGNRKRHGAIDEERQWYLAAKPEREGEAIYKVCPDCGEEVGINTKFCPVCGYEFDMEEQPLEGEAGDPAKVEDTKEKQEIRKEFVNAKSFADFERLGQRLGYKNYKGYAYERAVNKARTPEDFKSLQQERGYKIHWIALNALPHAKSYEDCLHIAEVCGYKKGWAWHQWQDIQVKVVQ